MDVGCTADRDKGWDRNDCSIYLAIINITISIVVLHRNSFSGDCCVAFIIQLHAPFSTWSHT